MDDVSGAVSLLFDALARHGRERARGDEEALTRTSIEVGGHVANVVGVAGRPLRGRLDGPPPKPVAFAMARAIFASPHLSRTLSTYTTASDTVVFHATDALADALDLPTWQLEELRAESDFIVADVLKQIRVLHWLWQRTGNPRVAPEPLFNSLFPGAVQPKATHFAYRGCRLYGVFDQPAPPPPEALFLHWLSGSERWTCVPDRHFSAAYVDTSLLRGCGRAVGASETEVVEILEKIVCAVPAADETGFVHRDRWRSEGWAALSGIGGARPGADWLTLPLTPDAIAPDDWLVATERGLELREPRRVFDRHAMTRLTAMTQGLYAEMCARLLAGRPIEPSHQAWLFDLDPYIQRVLQPLLDWAADARAHRFLAARLGVEVPHVAAAMAQVRDTWLKAARGSWGGVPSESRPQTVQSILAAHLAVSQSSLHRIWRQQADERAAHHRVLLLFFACYLKDAPLGRLWKPIDDRVPPPEDVVGDWFWGTWMRVLATLEDAG